MKILTILLIFLTQSLFTNAQNYAYTYAKIPLAEYVNILLRNDNSNNNNEIGGPVDGIFINTGYAFKIKPEFYVETGVDYLLLNRRGSKYFDNPNPKLSENILDVENSVLAFQLRPLWRKNISADDNAFFFAALGLNYQKLFSNASFTNYTLNVYEQQIESVVQSKAKSNFYWAAQPEIGIEFRNERNLGFRFGASYSYIDWSGVESKLKFQNYPSLVIAANRTSNLFFSFGFVY